MSDGGGEKSVKTEWVLPGTVAVFHALLSKFPASSGLADIFLLEFGNTKEAAVYRAYRLLALNLNHREIAAVELQQLPDERVLLTIHPHPIGIWRQGYEPQPDDASVLEDFRDRLLDRLIQLGVVSPPSEPPPAPRPFGFVPPAEQGGQ